MESKCSCCGFWFGKKWSGREVKASKTNIHKRVSKEHLLGYSIEEIDKVTHKAARQAAKSPLNHYSPPYNERSALSTTTATGNTVYENHGAQNKRSLKELRGLEKGSHQYDGPLPPLLPSKVDVKETHRVICSEDIDGKKMVNEYVRQYKIGTGSYGKVVLYRRKNDDKPFAIKIFHKSRLCKLRVSPTETAMVDVLREVAIMKQLDHPNIVRLFEVIDDPESDHLYLVLEYVEGNWIFEGCGPTCGIGDAAARRYFRDVVAGLTYLHGRNIIHGDIKPENLLISGDGIIKICDFGVSRMFEGDNDELRRSPGTPVYTAPECCLGLTYHGKPADVWALGCTLYCMVTGSYPFVGDTLQATYEKIVSEPVPISEDMNQDLADLLRGLLCKDVEQRLSLTAVSTHPWLTQGLRPSPIHDSHKSIGCGQLLSAPASAPALHEAFDNSVIELGKMS